MGTAFLSKKNTQCLKGLLCLFILWHHISQKSMRFYATNLGTVFQMMGYLSVAVFFFISGYGLIKSVDKSRGYIKTFPRNRLLTYYISVVLFTLIYGVARVIMLGSVDLKSLLTSLTYGGTIIANGWYLQVALVLYLLFYFSFIIINNSKKSITLCTALVFAFCVVSFIFKSPETWYESALAFPLGMIMAYSNKLDFLYKKTICFVVSAAVFVATVILEYLYRGSLLGIVCKMISALAFTICFLAAVCFISKTKAYKIIENPCLEWLGKRSLEIYALQGLFLNILMNVKPVYSSLPLYAVTSAALTFIFAALIHIPITAINKSIKVS